MFKSTLLMLWQTVKDFKNYEGRATRKEYWSFLIATFAVNIILFVLCAGISSISTTVGNVFAFLVFLAMIAELVIILALTVRRLHDIGLSGFWMLYLNPFIGLPLVYIVYLLGIDASCDKFVENVKKVGSPWLGWILLWLLWALGASGAMFLLFLYAGKKEANEYGASPYSE